MDVTKSRQALYAVAYSIKITAFSCATNPQYKCAREVAEGCRGFIVVERPVTDLRICVTAVSY